MQGAKYIMYSETDFIIFPATQDHIAMHQAYANEYKKPISAGFCTIEVVMDQYDTPRHKVQAYGNSYSLGLSARPEDGKFMSCGLSI